MRGGPRSQPLRHTHTHTHNFWARLLVAIAFIVPKERGRVRRLSHQLAVSGLLNALHQCTTRVLLSFSLQNREAAHWFFTAAWFKKRGKLLLFFCRSLYLHLFNIISVLFFCFCFALLFCNAEGWVWRCVFFLAFFFCFVLFNKFRQKKAGKIR